jgi:hypothetical protein
VKLAKEVVERISMERQLTFRDSTKPATTTNAMTFK